MFHGAVLAALATWRQCGRLVVLPHETFQPVYDHDMPMDEAFAQLRDQLPELCAYAASSGDGLEAATGVFVHLEWDPDLPDMPQIRFLLAHEPDLSINSLLAQPINVIKGATFTGALDDTWRRAQNRAELLFDGSGGGDERRHPLVEQQAESLGHTLAMALALGSPGSSGGPTTRSSPDAHPAGLRAVVPSSGNVRRQNSCSARTRRDRSWPAGKPSTTSLRPTSRSNGRGHTGKPS